jgi:glycolate oxidase FAD binding subunit
VAETVTPEGFEAAAAALAAAAAEGRAVRILGSGTKQLWGAHGPDPEVILGTSRLDRTLEHNAGDLTAIFEAGVPLARAQAELAAAGQRLAVDPPVTPDAREEGPGATIGGVFATADSGPVRHRYGQPRDLILGITIALSDGTIAKAGGKVIKNVAGYDLAKLFTGSFGTLGLILSVSVRLHPRPDLTATALGAGGDAAAVRTAAIALARAPLELEALDVAWRRGRGGLLAQAAGPEAVARCERAAHLMRETGLTRVEVTHEDEALWARQRAGQRSARRAIVRVAARPSRLDAVLTCADAGEATLVGRAALGISYLELEPEGLPPLRAALPAEAVAVVLDLPAGLRDEIDPWAAREGPALDLMRGLKRRFDPAAVCNPGIFVGGI